jgi:hypothetical protein
MRGPSISAARGRGVATTPITSGAARAIRDRGEGAQGGLHLPEHPIDAPRGAFRVPPGAGP